MNTLKRLAAGISVFVLIASFTLVPHIALAKDCNPSCGVGQTCDTTKGICTNPSAPQTNPTTVTNPSTQTTSGGAMLVNPIKVGSLPELLKVVIDALLEIGVIVLILAFVWVGFSFVRAQGKAEDLKKARSAFVWTVIGGAILLGAKAIATLVESTVQAL